MKLILVAIALSENFLREHERVQAFETVSEFEITNGSPANITLWYLPQVLV